MEKLYFDHPDANIMSAIPAPLTWAEERFHDNHGNTYLTDGAIACADGHLANYGISDRLIDAAKMFRESLQNGTSLLYSGSLELSGMASPLQTQCLKQNSNLLR